MIGFILEVVFPFVRKNWKVFAVVAAVAALVVGVGLLYSAYNIQKGLATKYKAERDAARIYQKITQDNLDICVETNKQWEVQGESWTAATEQLQQESEAYKSRLAAERQRRLAAIARLQDLEAEVSSQITSTDCNEAVVQFVTALGWSLP